MQGGLTCPWASLSTLGRGSHFPMVTAEEGWDAMEGCRDGRTPHTSRSLSLAPRDPLDYQ